MNLTIRGLVTACMTIAALPALAEGDPAKGATVFKKCAACHAAVADGPTKAGPTLFNVVGRTTASVEGFKYSDAMKKLGEEGHVWTAEELGKYLENPKQMVPGTKMTFVGLKKPEERADVIAYLESLK